MARSHTGQSPYKQRTHRKHLSMLIKHTQTCISNIPTQRARERERERVTERERERENIQKRIWNIQAHITHVQYLTPCIQNTMYEFCAWQPHQVGVHNHISKHTTYSNIPCMKNSALYVFSCSYHIGVEVTCTGGVQRGCPPSPLRPLQFDVAGYPGLAPYWDLQHTMGRIPPRRQRRR